jgi:hypothetical protein
MTNSIDARGGNVSDKTKPRYEYDADEEFFVDNTKPDEDGMGEELLTEEVVALLNAGEAAKQERTAILSLLDQDNYLPRELLAMVIARLAASETPGEEP